MAKVSVVIPTYNRSDILSRAIDSVLTQTFSDLELIIVDDGSTDSTEEVVESYNDDRIKYIKHTTNKNASAARNTGIQAASGEYIAFLDSDDEWHTQKLQTQLSQLRGRPGKWIGNYCATTVRRNSKLKKVVANTFDHDATNEGQNEIVIGLLTLTGFVHGGSTLLVKRSVVEAIDGFDEGFDRHQDVEFTIRLAQVGKLGYVNKPLVTLYESGQPAPSVVADSKQKLFDSFNSEINELESAGYEVRRVHQFELARSYISHGQFQKGINTLIGARPPNKRQSIGLLYDILRGTRHALLGIIYSSR